MNERERERERERGNEKMEAKSHFEGNCAETPSELKWNNNQISQTGCPAKNMGW